MKEQQVSFQADDARLEGFWYKANGEKGAVICHPHPQYGGTMHNNVVKAASKTFNAVGYSTLRFNFRGVENSTGQYGDGIAERYDVAAAFSFVRDQGMKEVVIAGYSFGGWVAAHTVLDLSAAGLLLISPPIAMFDIDFRNLALPLWVICGELDEYCPLGELKNRLQGVSTLKGTRWVEGADHFYWGHEESIQSAIKLWFDQTE